jgi:hypothetical protein
MAVTGTAMTVERPKQKRPSLSRHGERSDAIETSTFGARQAESASAPMSHGFKFNVLKT